MCFMENLSASYSLVNNVINFDPTNNELKLEYSGTKDNFDIVPTAEPY